MTVKRDIVEGMARCWSKLGQHDKALDLANLLVTTIYLSVVMALFCQQNHLKDIKLRIALDFCEVTKVTVYKQVEGKTDFLQAARTIP